MSIATAKALVPAKNFIPVSKPASLVRVSYDMYPKRYRDQVVLTIYESDESDGNYGPDGRRFINSRYAEFVDIYA